MSKLDTSIQKFNLDYKKYGIKLERNKNEIKTVYISKTNLYKHEIQILSLYYHKKLNTYQITIQGQQKYNSTLSHDIIADFKLIIELLKEEVNN